MLFAWLYVTNRKQRTNIDWWQHIIPTNLGRSYKALSIALGDIFTDLYTNLNFYKDVAIGKWWIICMVYPEMNNYYSEGIQLL